MKKFVVLSLLVSCGGASEEQEQHARQILNKYADEFKACIKLQNESWKALDDAKAATDERNFAQSKILRRKSEDLMDRFDVQIAKWTKKVHAEMESAGLPSGVRSSVTETWMRENGWNAHTHGGPEAGPVLMIPAAIEAGLGGLGKHGSMINREYGSSFRLACVMTDIPLIADRPDIFGADDFCLPLSTGSRSFSAQHHRHPVGFVEPRCRR